MKKYVKPIIDIAEVDLADVINSSGIMIENLNVFDGDGENV